MQSRRNTQRPGRQPPIRPATLYTEAKEADTKSQNHREDGNEGSFCYDCHMPKTLIKLATGVLQTIRTCKMSYIPSPANMLRHGKEGAPNTCTQCHEEQGVQLWYRSIAAQFMRGL